MLQYHDVKGNRICISSDEFKRLKKLFELMSSSSARKQHRIPDVVHRSGSLGGNWEPTRNHHPVLHEARLRFILEEREKKNIIASDRKDHIKERKAVS